MMHRRTFLRTLSVGAAACAVAPFETLARQAEPQRPNVLFIPIDDLKPLLGCYGAKHIHSPNIDRLAKRGVIFNNAQCQFPVSVPSRVSLLTGMYPDSTGIQDLRTQMRDRHPDALTLPQHFRNRGYASCGVGKTFDSRAVDKGHDTPSWSHGYVRHPVEQLNPNYPRPVGYGYLHPETRKRTAEVEELRRNHKGSGKEKWKLFQKVPGSRPAYESMDVPDDAYIDGAIANHGMMQLENLTSQAQPFFLSVGFFKPHLPFAAPKKYWDLYDPEEIDLAAYQELPRGGAEIAYQPGWELRHGYTGVPKGDLPEDYQRKLIHGYYACISYIDAQVGKLLDKLDELKIADNTIICLWGDHGWHLGDHNMWCKHSTFEQAMRSPLIICDPVSSRTPQASRGTIADGPVGFVDVFPTLCALAGLPTPEHLQGVDLSPMLRDTKVQLKSMQLSQYPRSKDGVKYVGYTLRSDRHRATFWLKREDAALPDAASRAEWVELYDYKTDPEERVNVAGDASYAAVLQVFSKALPQQVAHGRSHPPLPKVK